MKARDIMLHIYSTNNKDVIFMNILKQMILDKGQVINEDILKVDSFLNHQVDSKLMNQIGIEFYNHFKNNPTAE